ncbi:MAG: hypothetical protein P4L90_02015 [Rhodopila sp.]|nr:hypothetical protein [Rhodopila sp.]
MDYEKILARIYEHLEEDDVEAAVMGCLRLARGGKDFLNASSFLRELYPDRKEVARILLDDTSHLNEETQKFIFDNSLERWLEVHNIEELARHLSDNITDPGDRPSVLKVAIGELDAELEQCERTINDMAIPQSMGEFDAAAFTDRLMPDKAVIRLRIRALHTIRSRVKTRCLNYAIQIERQLDMQRRTQGFLEHVQNEANNYFKVRSNDVYVKLQKATQLALSDDPEDSSLLLAEVRRTAQCCRRFFLSTGERKGHLQ